MRQAKPMGKEQRGAALVLMFVTMVLVLLTVVMSALSNRNVHIAQARERQEEMQRVKDVLLGFAVTDSLLYGRGPGRLPCPDINNSGADTCNTVNFRRLPQTLTLPSTSPLVLSTEYAGLDQQFWYAVTPAYKTSSTLLNSRSAGAFSIDGVAGYAAVLLSPGEALSGQNRPHNTQADRYLESTNAGGVNFVSTGGVNVLNDTVLGITDKEIMSLTSVRVAQEVKRVLDVYYPANGNDYPLDLTSFQAAMINPTYGAAAWVASNDWLGGTFTYTRTGAGQARIQFESCAIQFSFGFGAATIARSSTSC